MKACNTCGVEKPLSEFYKHHLARDGHEPRCKTCKVKVAREHRNSWKIQAIKDKGGKCEMCGGEFPPCVYDFHHTSDDKEVSPGKANSKHQFFREIEKCMLLCANCHRIIHHV